MFDIRQYIKTLLFLFVVGINTLNAQKAISEVVTVESISAEDLHSRAKHFVANAFENPKYVTDLTDDHAKTIVVRGIFKVKSTLMAAQSHVRFQITIESKPGRYRYQFTDIYFVYQAGTLTREKEYELTEEDPGGLSKKQWRNIQSQSDERFKILVQSLKAKMTEGSDW